MTDLLIDTAAAPTTGGGIIRMSVMRYRPDVDLEPRWQEYDVPWTVDTSVLEALNYIKDHLDATLTYRWSCRMAICGSCGFMINGVPKLGCDTFVRDYAPGPLQIGALENFAIERDLVVDISPFMEKLAAVQPYVVRADEGPLSEGENLQTPEEMAKYMDFASCINCMLCYSACPQVALVPDFLGPAAITLAVRYNKDSRDEGEQLRLPALDTEDGLWPCTFVGACTTVCPKGVDPASAIQQAKLATAKDWAMEFVLPHRGRST